MAFRTITPLTIVFSTIDRKVLSVVVKCGRRPFIFRVAGGTIRRELQVGVVRIGCLVVISLVAGCAVSWRTCIPGGMAFDTVCGQVHPGQWESRQVMVKYIIRATRWVTGQTGRRIIGITIYTCVFIVSLRIGMTGHAGKFGVIRRIRMAVHTLVPLPVVFSTIDRKILSIVVKGRRYPLTFRVAGRTIR